MGMFDLPRGEVELLMDGKWESVAFTDRPSKDELMHYVEYWSKYHTVTALRYNSNTFKNEAPVIYWKKED